MDVVGRMDGLTDRTASSPADANLPIGWRRAVLLAVLLALAAAVVTGAVWVHRFATSFDAPIPVRPPSPLRALSDIRPVTVTVTTPDWKKVRHSTTFDGLRSDHVLWRQMHFDDWDHVPMPLRREALRLMTSSYAEVFDGPASWRRAGPADWDDVPQPVRAMAYLRMIWYWARHERVGAEFGLQPEALAPSIAAIVMAESWFEHRAVNENQYGRDLGLAQCSDFCRKELLQMAFFDEIAFFPIEPDYFNPWTATRIATVWFERELLRSGGDVDLAIRAYHRGQDSAMDEKGDGYLRRVRRLRESYIRTQRASPSWAFLASTIAPL